MNCENCQRVRAQEKKIEELKGALAFYCEIYKYRPKGLLQALREIFPIKIGGKL